MTIFTVFEIEIATTSFVGLAMTELTDKIPSREGLGWVEKDHDRN